MTSQCHKKCFKKESLTLDQNCITSCYHKYIHTISRYNDLTKNIGKAVCSDYVFKTFNFDEDPVSKLNFPYGGTKIGHPILIFKYWDEVKIFLYEGRFDFKSKDEMR